VALLLKKRGISRVRPLAGGLDAWRRLLASSRGIAAS
jgi:rhodanese-related sulfurtransferase